MSKSVLKMNTVVTALTVFALASCGASTADSVPAKMNASQVVSQAAAQTNSLPAIPKLKLQKIDDDIHVIFGPGGNIGVSTGPDGVIIIDDKFADNANEILSLLKGVTDEPLKFVLNTHYHGDHTGSNDKMKSAGATIVAHYNVRKRMGMSIENKLFKRNTKPASKDKWPSLTFSEDITFHMNDHTVTLLHSPGHTDGDSLVHFKEANIIHMGDNFFNGMFPYIDIDAGGSVAGMIAAHDRALLLADDNTQIIPGHGPMSTKADLQKARDMLVDINRRVKARLRAGDTLDALISSNILLDYADYSGFIDQEKMIRITHRSLVKP